MVDYNVDVSLLSKTHKSIWSIFNKLNSIQWNWKKNNRNFTWQTHILSAVELKQVLFGEGKEVKEEWEEGGVIKKRIKWKKKRKKKKKKKVATVIDHR